MLYTFNLYTCIIFLLFKHILLQTSSPRESLIKGDYVGLFTELLTSKQKGLHQKGLHQNKDRIIIAWKKICMVFILKFSMKQHIIIRNLYGRIYHTNVLQNKFKKVTRPETALYLE
jgi:hypothetical protein